MDTSKITVAELVTERPSRSRFFEQLGIDYCCGGKRPLDEVCSERGLDAATLLATLTAQEASEASEAMGDGPTAATPPDELIRHIVEVHHEYLRTELPRLAQIGAHVADHHGEREPRLLRVVAALGTLSDELTEHLRVEEEKLFPAIEAATTNAATGRDTDVLRSMIGPLEDDHERTGELLLELRTYTDNYTVPAWGCNSLRAFYDGLRELEYDIHLHVHKENNLLFPMVQAH